MRRLPEMGGTALQIFLGEHVERDHAARGHNLSQSQTGRGNKLLKYFSLTPESSMEGAK